MQTALARIILFTHDVDRLRRFYMDNFGLTVVSEEPGWVELSGEGCNLALHKAQGPKTASTNSNFKLSFGMADVSAVRKELEAKGLKFGKTFTWQGFEFADTEDPDGNPVQISSRGMR